MNRRRACRMLVGSVVALAHGVHAAAPSPRVGFLSPTTKDGSAAVLAALHDGLRANGFGHASVEPRYANDRFDRLPALARELVAIPVDVVVAFVTEASIAAAHATHTIPIVMLGTSDPVASGVVRSLGQPDGNVTGTSGAFADLAGKRLELLLEVAAGNRKVAVLWNPSNRVFQQQVIDATRVAAQRVGAHLVLFEAADARSLDSAFAEMSRATVTAVNVLPDPVFAANFPRIAQLAAAARMPSISANSSFADAGGLMAYGPNIPDLARAAARYTARILQGMKPSQLAIEGPTTFELTVNLNVARQIGVTLPETLLLRATRLIR